MSDAIRRYFPAFLIALVMAGACMLLLYRLGAEPFLDYDEATYAETTAESLASHDYLTFTYLDVLDFRKPPLLYWLTDTSRSIFSGANEAEFADRLPGALAAIALIGVVMLVVYGATGNAYAAAFGGGVLLATSAFIEPAREVRFDILVSLFDTLAVYSFYRALGGSRAGAGAEAPACSDRRWFLAVGLFIGLAFLSKDPLIFYALVPMLVFAALMRKWRWFIDPYFWGGVAVALIVVVPWHLYETLRYGWAFWQEYLGQQVVSRVATDLFGAGIGPTNSGYIMYLLSFAAPWPELLGLSVLAYFFLRRTLAPAARALYLSMIIGVLTVIIVCLVTQTKAISYLIPLYAYMAIAIGIAGYALYRYASGFARALLVVAAVICLLAGLGASVENGWHLSPYYGSEIGLAEEEKAIGTDLRAAGAQTFYIYNTTTLGSIMFYSGILQPPWISVNAKLPTGAYLLYQTAQASQLAKANPALNLKTVYRGSVLTLAEETGAAPASSAAPATP